MYEVRRKESCFEGLKYMPQLLNYPMDADKPIVNQINGRDMRVPGEFSKLNQKVLLDVVQELGDNMRAVVEIGTARNFEDSSTKVICENKPKECIYLGIDKLSRAHLHDIPNNIFHMKANSHFKKVIRSYMKEVGIDKIDLLMIDGWHSVDTVLNDWEYTEWLSPYGVVVFHDISIHPGPKLVFNAIDEEKYSKAKYGCGVHTDWGIGVARRRKK